MSERRIRMKTLMAGPHGVRVAGSEHVVERAEAERLVAAGAAEDISTPARTVETAAVATAENASTRTGRPPARRRSAESGAEG